MKRTTKALLVIAVLCLLAGLAFAADLVPVPNPAPFYVLLPTGTIVFGLFLISRMLEKETTRYDQEHQASLDHAADLEEEESRSSEKTRPPAPHRESFVESHSRS